ncbi:MAG: GNAT family N-acetyltransferase [Chloroflexota bacterium]
MSSPTVEQAATVDAFLDAAGPFLAAREAEHNLILGICSTVQARLAPADEPLDFLVVRSDGAVVLAAVRTPPWNLVLSEVDDPTAVVALADALTDRDLPGVLGPTESAGIFAERWTLAAGRTPRLAVSERIFRLTEVRPPAPPPGRLRTARLEDRSLLIAWFKAFEREALPEALPVDIPILVDRRLDQGGMYLWDDGEPVSLAAVGSRTPHGIRVGPVYTPPDRRGRGYASACVASASQAQLDAGLDFVFLFTDLANLTSNHIYQAIGYEPVRDVDSWRFDR